MKKPLAIALLAMSFVVTAADQDFEHRTYYENLEREKIDPNMELPEGCVKPVDLAMKDWAGDGLLNWENWAKEMHMTSSEIATTRVLTRISLTKQTASNSPQYLERWWLAEARLRKTCAYMVNGVKSDAEKAALQKAVDDLLDKK